MAFDFPNSPSEGTVFSPGGGPVYIYTGGVWRIQAQPEPDHIMSVPHDMRATFIDDVGTKYFVVQDKADGTGDSMFWMQEDGTLWCGHINGSDIISATNTFLGQTASALLAPTTAGTVYLRPNGPASAVGELTVATNGYVDAKAFRTPGDGNGYLYGNLVNKAARSGGYGASVTTFYYTSGLHAYIDDTDLGVIYFTSDYRIKKDVADLPSMWAQVKALRPISYTQAEFHPPSSVKTREALETAGAPPAPSPLFENDDTPRWGFIAHELQETLLPETANGVKDMEDGVQSLNWPPLVAALTKALQETMERVEALEATVLTLRGNPDG